MMNLLSSRNTEDQCHDIDQEEDSKDNRKGRLHRDFTNATSIIHFKPKHSHGCELREKCGNPTDQQI